MSTTTGKAKQLMSLYSNGKSFEEVLQDVSQKAFEDLPLVPNMPATTSRSSFAMHQRIEILEAASNVKLDFLAGIKGIVPQDAFHGNIENFIGITQVPTGIAGPIYINGTSAHGDYYIPLATTEGALVASYHRGAKVTRLSGGISVVCTTEGVQRTPVWKFDTLVEVGRFVQWFLERLDTFKDIVKTKSNHAVLNDVRLNMEGNQVLTIFEYTCGEAAGQNMVTICTDAVCRYILEHTIVQPRYWFIESNYSGDKKATAVSFTSVRGKKVTAESLIKKELVASLLKSSPQQMAAYWQSSVVAASQSGSIGLQGHFANGLTALFLACGQDVACVSEAYVGITRMEVSESGDLYVAITLPSLVVGTVGGGTCLPTQNECLRLLNCQGPGSARKFAEICGAVALAGEVSVAAALASGDFARAHQLFRKKKPSL